MSEEPVIGMHHCVDMEQHARSFNEGYEAAVAQGLADDPTLAGDWLDEQKRRAVDEALAEVERRLRASVDDLRRGGLAPGGEYLAWINCTLIDAHLIAEFRAEVGER